jgi:hypothetical protein
MLNMPWPTVAFVAAILAAANGAAAQSPPPVQGTVALEGTMKKFYRGVSVVVGSTYRFVRDVFVPGGNGSGLDGVEGLREGSTVVVEYTVEGAQQAGPEVDVIGLEATEGTVTRIDRGRRQIAVRYVNGNTEIFGLTERAPSEAPKDADRATPAATKVIIHYSDERGQRVAHFFWKVPK